MEFLAARAGDDVDDPMAVTPGLRRVIRFKNLHFLDRLHRREHVEAAVSARVHRDRAVVGELVHREAAAVNRHQRISLLSDPHHASGLARHHPGAERQELGEVAAVERELGDLGAGDERAHFSGLGLHGRNCVCHGHGFADLTHLERDVDGETRLGLEANAAAHKALESRQLGLDLVVSDRERRGDVDPPVVADHAASQIGGELRHRDLRTRDERAGAVRNETGDGPGPGALTVKRNPRN